MINTNPTVDLLENKLGFKKCDNAQVFLQTSKSLSINSNIKDGTKGHDKDPQKEKEMACGTKGQIYVLPA